MCTTYPHHEYRWVPFSIERENAYQVTRLGPDQSVAEIAEALSTSHGCAVTRSAVIGKGHRLGLPSKANERAIAGRLRQRRRARVRHIAGGL